MNNNIIIWSTLLIFLMKMTVRSYDIFAMPLYNYRQLRIRHKVPVKKLIQLHPSVLQRLCYVNGVLTECPFSALDYSSNTISNIARNFESFTRVQSPRDNSKSKSGFERTSKSSSNSNEPPLFRRMLIQNSAPNLNMLSLYGRSAFSLPQNTANRTSIGTDLKSSKLNMKLDGSSTKHNKYVPVTTESSMDKLLLSRRISSHEDLQDFELTKSPTIFLNSTAEISLQDTPEHDISEQFTQSLDNFNRIFYATTFSKLTSLSPPSRRQNGMSFVQSGLFLQLALMALSTEVGPEARQEIDESLGLYVSDQERVQLINATVSSLPAPTDALKFRWSSRLVLISQNVSEHFRTTAAKALRLQVDRFNGIDTPKQMADVLNHMVEVDTGGAIHETFEEDDLSEGVRAILISTLYLRARWRSAPTLLNGTHTFHDSQGAPNRTVRMIRVNDNMRYAELTEWDAEALEIFYFTPGLSLLMLVPRGNSLRRLAEEAQHTNLRVITERMQPLRVAATLPLYTLRMTLLLPNKLEAMNISHLVDTNNGSQSDSFRLSHAVQRIMFWAEAGRNAFKDDGIEWDEAPQRTLVVDRPYIFYVRWKNNTLMNGNFVL